MIRLQPYDSNTVLKNLSLSSSTGMLQCFPNVLEANHQVVLFMESPIYDVHKK